MSDPFGMTTPTTIGAIPATLSITNTNTDTTDFPAWANPRVIIICLKHTNDNER